MPVVTVDWWSGQDHDRRRRLVQEVSETVSRIADCPLQAVTVIVRDVEPTHWGSGGTLAADH
ncbi:tautomerase family protein [Streptomyces sp. NPDC002055]|uniref:tautomerase family protein n=1 Tax=Streptomyces sp. NPDC002055 TaxID=3154534 RepID=UPI00332D2641